jgi:hypothetical protein
MRVDRRFSGAFMLAARLGDQALSILSAWIQEEIHGVAHHARLKACST